MVVVDFVSLWFEHESELVGWGDGKGVCLAACMLFLLITANLLVEIFCKQNRKLVYRSCDQRLKLKGLQVRKSDVGIEIFSKLLGKKLFSFKKNMTI